MLYMAAFFICVLALAHSFLGERFILIRLFRRDNLPVVFGSTAFTVGTVRFVWHLTSILGLGIAAMLILLADEAPAAHLAATIGWTMMLSGMLPLILTRGRHLSWIVLFAVGGLCLFWASR